MHKEDLVLTLWITRCTVETYETMFLPQDSLGGHVDPSRSTQAVCRRPNRRGVNKLHYNKCGPESGNRYFQYTGNRCRGKHSVSSIAVHIDC